MRYFLIDTDMASDDAEVKRSLIIFTSQEISQMQQSSLRLRESVFLLCSMTRFGRVHPLHKSVLHLEACYGRTDHACHEACAS